MKEKKWTFGTVSIGIGASKLEIGRSRIMVMNDFQDRRGPYPHHRGRRSLACKK